MYLEGKDIGLLLKYYPGILLKGLRKATKNLCWVSRSPVLKEQREYELNSSDLEGGIL
jgi:hypothetical protein